MGVVANAVVRTTERCWARCVEGRYESAAELMDVDFVHDDRRNVLRNTIAGREDTLTANRIFTEMGFVIELEPLVVRGERLALVRATFRNSDDFEVVALQVLEANENGLRKCCVSFDENNLDEAMNELNALDQN